ncbi:MAG: hypothetical protein ACLQLC_11345 [Candidatus Sulfotelmatobacter sp.]
MVNPISSIHSSQPNEAVQSTLPKPQPEAPQKAAPQPSDTVTLKSIGDVDHDGSK